MDYIGRLFNYTFSLRGTFKAIFANLIVLSFSFYKRLERERWLRLVKENKANGIVDLELEIC